MKILQQLKITLALLPLLACGKAGVDDSDLKIRQGTVVSARSTGPERVSTNGIVGITRQEQYTCSAALIAKDKLVTAAHCVAKGAQLYAIFGTNLATATEKDFVLVNRSIVHPEYFPTGSGLPAHDIAVLRLSRPASSAFKPIAILPSDESLQDLDTVLLAGYGITEYGNDSGVLRATLATFAGFDSIGRLQINDRQKRGACSGDSGGPLFARVDGRYYVAGVLSGGPIPCRGINLYTSLAQHHDFIQESVTRLSL
jgi:secreted trypsin-like serine protease